MDVQNAILARHSTRGFDDTPLTESEIRTLLAAALASPSCMNAQPWHFAFIADKALIDEMDEVMREAYTVKFGSKSEKRHFYNAPLFVAVTYNASQKNRYTELDCGIAVENLALSATGLGLGSVIIHTPSEALASARGAYFKEKAGIPIENEYAIGIIIGHSNVDAAAHEIKEGRYSIV